MIISSALVFVWYLQTKQTTPPKEMSIDMAVTRLANKELKEAVFKQSQVEFTDVNNNHWVTSLGSDPTREFLVKKIGEFNDANSSSQIKTTEEQVSSGLGWLMLVNALP